MTAYAVLCLCLALAAFVFADLVNPVLLRAGGVAALVGAFAFVAVELFDVRRADRG